MPMKKLKEMFSMILTGKCKEDFLSYYGTGENYFKATISKIEQFANIIDFFDSVGIYILITDFDGSDYWCEFNGLNHSVLGKTRQEAIEQAIIHANKIYNNG